MIKFELTNGRFESWQHFPSSDHFLQKLKVINRYKHFTNDKQILKVTFDYDITLVPKFRILINKIDF